MLFFNYEIMDPEWDLIPSNCKHFQNYLYPKDCLGIKDTNRLRILQIIIDLAFS